MARTPNNANAGGLGPNGRYKFLWHIGAVIFACGILWSKVDNLEHRVASIERILMDKPDVSSP